MERMENKWEKLKKIIKEDMELNQKEYEQNYLQTFKNYASAENWVLDRIEELEKAE